jgi:hypothetical protein
VGQDHPHVQTMLQQFMETVIFSYLVAAHILAAMACMYLTLSMMWSQPQTQGTVPSPCARHAGATIGKSFYIIGGGDNKSDIYSSSLLFFMF